jgi:glycosyltransferase involved in cell wall biosynthesis
MLCKSAPSVHESLRILVVCPCPMQLELGAAQVHLNLAEGLRTLGHSVRVWSPYPLPDRHWTVVELDMRAKLGEFLRTGGTFDVVDCPPVLARGPFVDPNVTWVARSVQPDLLYMWETLRGRPRDSAGGMVRTAALATWSAGLGALIYRGWSVSDIIMCFGSPEREWIRERFPWLRPKLRSYDGALSEADRDKLARVRRARRPRDRHETVRYLWIGRWVDHKGVDTLLGFLRQRLVEGTKEQFTVAGCGPLGERALGALVGSGRIRVVPSFTRAELPALLAAHDVGLFTSRVENQAFRSTRRTPGAWRTSGACLGPSSRGFPRRSEHGRLHRLPTARSSGTRRGSVGRL